MVKIQTDTVSRLLFTFDFAAVIRLRFHVFLQLALGNILDFPAFLRRFVGGVKLGVLRIVLLQLGLQRTLRLPALLSGVRLEDGGHVVLVGTR